MTIHTLNGADLAFQPTTAWLAAHMLQSLSKDAPESINDLCTTFHNEDLTTWQLVLVNLRLMRFHPSGLALDYDSLLHVDNMIMNDAWNLDLVSTSAIGVQHDISGVQELLGNTDPFLTTDRARSGRPLRSEFRFQNGRGSMFEVCPAPQGHPTAPI